jgi:glycosyltransferase involved in cell wall biosynthesis
MPFKTRWDLRDSLLESEFAHFLYENEINFVHFNHLLNTPFSLIEICKLLNIPTIATWHDYYGICHNFLLYSPSTGYCGFLEGKSVDHDACLKASYGFPSGAWKRRKTHLTQLISEFNYHIFPSYFAKNKYMQTLKNVTFRNPIVISPPLPLLSKLTQSKRFFRKRKKYIAFIGNVSEHKGKSLLLDLAKCIDRAKYQILVLGHIQLGERELIDLNIEGPHPYSPGEYEIFNKFIDEILVTVAISQWPETFQIVVDEISSLGIPVIVSDLGAPKERAQTNDLILPVPNKIDVIDLYKEICRLDEVESKEEGNMVQIQDNFEREILAFYQSIIAFNEKPSLSRNFPDHLKNNLTRIFEHIVLYPKRWN